MTEQPAPSTEVTAEDLDAAAVVLVIPADGAARLWVADEVAAVDLARWLRQTANRVEATDG